MPNMFSIADYRRCYVLYENVASNIPRWGSIAEPRAWDYARGVLVELYRRLGDTRLELIYRELDTPGERCPIGHEVTAVLRTGAGLLVTVKSLVEAAPHGDRGDFWQMTVNGVVPDDGTSPYRPSSPWLAWLVQRHLRQAAYAETRR
jgi:hypothetical protein